MARRVPFEFRQRVELARIYLDDGALLTASDRLEALAADLRGAHFERMASIGVEAPDVTDAERVAFLAGWNARETGSAHHADGRENCVVMFGRGFNFGDADTGENLTRRHPQDAEAAAAMRGTA